MKMKLEYHSHFHSKRSYENHRYQGELHLLQKRFNKIYSNLLTLFILIKTISQFIQ